MSCPAGSHHEGYVLVLRHDRDHPGREHSDRASGRALAGAAGSSEARIIATSMEAELVSIGGVYRTFEDGWPKELKGQAVQVLLQDERLELRLMALK
jgi:hypothetical protein